MRNNTIEKLAEDNLNFNYSELMIKHSRLKPYFTTKLGAIFDADCLTVLPAICDEIVDTVFADPPFNLSKEYGKNSVDNRSESDYLTWCYKWIDESIRILKPGGALFIYNLPKWNIQFGSYLTTKGMDFRHWIAISMSNTLPLPGRLYPAHYSLLYYTKGKPTTFNKIRTPIETCRHCNKEIKDYGGHRKSMNPKGVNLKDIWTDIPPVRHRKFQTEGRNANAISTKLLDRVVELSTNEGDLVVDPFGGSGTTYAVCEKKHRHWIGTEIDFAQAIKNRLSDSSVDHHKNDDYVENNN